MRHERFAEIAKAITEEASATDGVAYRVWTESADYGDKVRVEIFVAGEDEGSERTLFRTPKELKNLPRLTGLSEPDAAALMRSWLRDARANYEVGVDLSSGA